MKLAEFYVFLCRITYENFRGTPYENELMYLKLNNMLPKFLAPYFLTPVFLFDEEFEYKPAIKNKKTARK